MATATRKRKKEADPAADINHACEEIQRLQRKRVVAIKSRVMQTNRLVAVIAGTLGYEARMSEKDRKAKMDEAAAAIKGVRGGTASHDYDMLIHATLDGADGLESLEGNFLKEMVGHARTLPVAAWAEGVRGFGVPMLSVVIGESGNLTNYPNPAKVWKRFGCAPWTYRGKTLMGSTWRCGRDGKEKVTLAADQWEEFGYSPRRRAVAYLIGYALRNGNQDIYRAQYDEARADMLRKRPDASPQRCDRHGMLLATKLLLLNLWATWHGRYLSERL
jgi:hypothetical protein